MDKVCGNHPESLALATCKACEKAICLMCVHDEREGTFCSENCIRAFRDGVPVPAAEPVAATADPAPAASASVWDDMPAAERAAFEAAPAEEAPAPEPEPAPEAAPVPSTKSIGNPCWQHTDIRAKAFCAACKRPICGLCIVENPAGMFCSDACAKGLRGKRGLSAGAKVAVVLFLLLAGGGAALALKPEWLEGVKRLAGLDTQSPQPPPPPVVINPTPPVAPPKPTTPTTNPSTNPKPPPVAPKPPPPPVKVVPKGPPPPPVPILPPPPRPPKPEPPKQTRMIHPWMAENQGVWYRVQTIENGSTRTTDIGLKDRDPVSFTLQVQEDGGPVRETRTEVLPVEIWGEENLQIEDRSWACEIRGTKKIGGGYDRTWVLSQSRHAGAVLMQETPEGKVVAQRVWEHTLRVGSRTYDCLVVESRVEGSGRLYKSWYSPAYPLGVVRVESERGSVALVAAGDGWANRPPIR